jgi:hypothetical protein
MALETNDEPPAKRPKTEEEKEKEEGEFRFAVGQQVLCNISTRASGFLWKVGAIVEVAYRPPPDESQNNKIVFEDDGGCAVIPYVVKLDNGNTVAVPEDDDECVRLAARCCDDTRIMRQLAFSEEQRRETCLRFSEGYRVSVQLDVGIWEEGVIVEAWAIPERNGRPLKTWAGFAVPYAVNLDIGDTVLVPFDTDEVVRPEHAARPPQKTIAEQVGGTTRPLASNVSETANRFVEHQNASGEWVRRDTRTGIERPCVPPSPKLGPKQG